VLVFFLDFLHLRLDVLHRLHGFDLLHGERVGHELDEDGEQDDGKAVALKAGGTGDGVECAEDRLQYMDDGRKQIAEKFDQG